MNIRENLNMAVKTITANKLRSLLTVLGIVIGNASVVAMIGIGQGAQKFTEDKIETLGSNLLYVFVGYQDVEGGNREAAELLLSDAEAIAAQAPAVKAVSPAIAGNFQLTYQSRTTKAMVRGVMPSFIVVRNLKLEKGQFFGQEAQTRRTATVVLGPELAKRLFETQNPIGQEVQIAAQSFQVIGVTQAKGAFLGANPDAEAFIPITVMADQLAGKRSPRGIPIDEMEVSARDKASIRAAAFQVTNILTRLHGKKDFTVIANKSLQDTLGQITGALSLMLAAIAGISLLVGGIGIMNIMLVSVSERTQEIGLRKAIGAPEQAILMQFLIEAILLSIAGGLIGIGGGVGITLLIGVLTPLQPVVPASAIILATSVSGGIGLIFGVVPARRAAKLDPIVALRSS
jgi:putative ABC transport system permease protein